MEALVRNSTTDDGALIAFRYAKCSEEFQFQLGHAEPSPVSQSAGIASSE